MLRGYNLLASNLSLHIYNPWRLLRNWQKHSLCMKKSVLFLNIFYLDEKCGFKIKRLFWILFVLVLMKYIQLFISCGCSIWRSTIWHWSLSLNTFKSILNRQCSGHHETETFCFDSRSRSLFCRTREPTKAIRWRQEREPFLFSISKEIRWCLNGELFDIRGRYSTMMKCCTSRCMWTKCFYFFKRSSTFAAKWHSCIIKRKKGEKVDNGDYQFYILFRDIVTRQRPFFNKHKYACIVTL